jgi:hypothetical protein
LNPPDDDSQEYAYSITDLDNYGVLYEGPLTSFVLAQNADFVKKSEDTKTGSSRFHNHLIDTDSDPDID